MFRPVLNKDRDNRAQGWSQNGGSANGKMGKKNLGENWVFFRFFRFISVGMLVFYTINGGWYVILQKIGRLGKIKTSKND